MFLVLMLMLVSGLHSLVLSFSSQDGLENLSHIVISNTVRSSRRFEYSIVEKIALIRAIFLFAFRLIHPYIFFFFPIFGIFIPLCVWFYRNGPKVVKSYFATFLEYFAPVYTFSLATERITHPYTLIVVTIGNRYMTYEFS